MGDSIRETMITSGRRASRPDHTPSLGRSQSRPDGWPGRPRSSWGLESPPLLQSQDRTKETRVPSRPADSVPRPEQSAELTHPAFPVQRLRVNNEGLRPDVEFAMLSTSFDRYVTVQPQP